MSYYSFNHKNGNGLYNFWLYYKVYYNENFYFIVSTLHHSVPLASSMLSMFLGPHTLQKSLLPFQFS